LKKKFLSDYTSQAAPTTHTILLHTATLIGLLRANNKN